MHFRVSRHCLKLQHIKVPMMTTSLIKFIVTFDKESRVSRCFQNSDSPKNEIYWCKQKSNHQCLPHGARQQQFACPSKHFLPESSVLAGHWFCTVTQQCWHVLLQSHPHPRRGTYLHTMSPMSVERQKFLSRILQIGATGGRWGPVSTERTWERAESWAHIRREAEGRRRD